MDLVQDSASAAGLGDAGKRVMEQYELESEIKKREKATAGAGKAAQAKLMETYGGVLSKPYEEFKPSQESLGGFAALGSLLMVAGAMMGGQGRLSGIGAMNNIAGMMKGYQEGRKDLYEQERKQFEENMKTFEKNRGMIKEAFDRALKIAPTNLKLANDMLRRDLQALGATVPAEMVGKSGAVQAAGSYQTFSQNTDKTLEQLRAQLSRSKALSEAQKADIAAKKADTGTYALEYGMIDGQKAMYTREQILDAQKSGKKFTPLARPTGSEAAATKETTLGAGSRAQLGRMIGAEAAAATPEKEAEKIVGQVRSVKATVNLIKAAQDPDINFGEIGRLSTVASSIIDRNLPKDGVNSSTQAQAVTNDSIDEAAKKAGLSSTDKNVVFYKKAVFTALELEREARGGSILPVAVMRTLGPLLDPKSMTREAYSAILKDRAEEVGRATGLTQEQLIKALSAVPEISIDIPMAQTAAPSGGKKTAEERFNELISQGVSEDDAYNTLAQEGYK